MATYKMLQNGSSGSDVKKLQQTLVDAGYDVGSAGVDGIYGNATTAAVKKYQQDNGLKVDGIAGDQTLGSLYSVKAPAASTETKAPAANTPTTTVPQYTYNPASDDAYQQALEQLKQLQGQTPAYKGTYDQQIKDMYDQIANREKFSYDMNADALYQQYKDQFTQQGKLAMMDTMGQAAALTGGYGNSYAQNVGQQAYQGYLQQLNDVVPELYGMALDQYNAEGDRMVQQFGMLGDMADTEYGRYQDDLAQYWQNMSFQKEQADDAYNRGFAEWQTGYENQYQAGRDQVADQQWQAEFDEAKRQYDEQYAFAQQQYNDSKSGGSSGGVDSSGNDSTSGGYDTHGYTTEQIKQLQRNAGITADGIWGPQTEKAYQAGYRPGGEEEPKTWKDYDADKNKEAQAENGGSFYEDALADLKTMKKSGKSNSEAAAFLQEMLGNSLLTLSEYSTLYNKYRNNGL